jgi:Lar family restriction alleviation protein
MTVLVKPCPFCGDVKTLRTIADPNQGGKWGYIECGICGARGPEMRTGYLDPKHWRHRAIDEWNRREVKP